MIPLDTQTNIIVQNLGTWLKPVMDLFSFMGIEPIMLCLIAVTYWCISPRIGSRLGLFLFATSSLNSLFKIVFHLPRPYWVDPNVKAYAAETGFGFPSGHSQKSAAFWGLLGWFTRKPFIMILAGLLIIFIGISRLYLGVHFLADVLAGWSAGLFALALFVILDKPVSRWFAKNTPLTGFLVAAGFSSILIILGLSAKSSLADWTIPATWLQLSARAGKINPVSVIDLFSGCGIFLGFAGGICWLRMIEQKNGSYDPAGTISEKVWRTAAGFSGFLFIYAVLGAILPHDETMFGLICRLIRYGLSGFWITGLAPYVFMKSGLVGLNTPNNVESSLVD